MFVSMLSILRRSPHDNLVESIKNCGLFTNLIRRKETRFFSFFLSVLTWCTANISLEHFFEMTQVTEPGLQAYFRHFHHR